MFMWAHMWVVLSHFSLSLGLCMAYYYSFPLYSFIVSTMRWPLVCAKLFLAMTLEQPGRRWRLDGLPVYADASCAFVYNVTLCLLVLFLFFFRMFLVCNRELALYMVNLVGTSVPLCLIYLRCLFDFCVYLPQCQSGTILFYNHHVHDLYLVSLRSSGCTEKVCLFSVHMCVCFSFLSLTLNFISIIICWYLKNLT